jgi:hypothetical protein
VSTQGKELGKTREISEANARKLDETRRQLAQQTEELVECRRQLKEALEAQQTNEALIQSLKEEVAHKTVEIEQLKADIRQRDVDFAKMSTTANQRIEEMEKRANERVDSINNKAKEQLREIQGLEAAAVRRAEEAEVERALAVQRAEEAEAKQAAAFREVEEAEVAAQVQPREPDDEDRMEVEEEKDNVPELGVNGFSTHPQIQATPQRHQSVPPPTTPASPPSSSYRLIRSPLRSNSARRNPYTKQDRAQSTPPMAGGVPSPATFTHSKGGSGPRLILSPNPSTPPSASASSIRIPPRLPTVDGELPTPTSNTPSPSATPAPTEGSILPRVLDTLSSIDSALKNLQSPSKPARERKKKAVYHQREIQRTKDSDRTSLLAQVRMHMNGFLKIAKDIDLLTSPVATDDTATVEAYEDGGSDNGPVLDPMHPHWSILKCRWNLDLGALFAKYMVTEVGIAKDDETQVENMFAERLVRLRTMLVKYARKDRESDAEWAKRVKEEIAGDVIRNRRHARRAKVSIFITIQLRRG